MRKTHLFNKRVRYDGCAAGLGRGVGGRGLSGIRSGVHKVNADNLPGKKVEKGERYFFF